MNTIEEWVKASTECAQDHGFKVTEDNLPGHLMLVVTEVAEAMEEWRLPEEGYMDRLTEELSDVILRTFNIAGFLNLPLEDVMRKKHAKNLGRPFKHGGKRL